MELETIQTNDTTNSQNLYMAIELSNAQWKLGFTTGLGQAPRLRSLEARDFMELAKRYPHHAGILLSEQKPMSKLLSALDQMFGETYAEDWSGQIRWLNDWMK